MAQFYEITQNNSGGVFVVNDKVCHRLFIEADSAEEANEIAESLGCYWDGCAKGWDCSCCGDRWYPTSSPVDLERINERGYKVSVYDHYKNAEQRWYDKYGNYTILQEPRWENDLFRKFVGTITFRNIEEYAQFLADEFGWTTPDARIFYKDGAVIEINRGDSE